ncbi:hypothetical protein Z043_103480 [Scleropages formosus]|uniref:BRCT domain-containing protein n=1 Tax=Scleropages formosus TaxID=113540 RepID=A0A0P7VSZ9_SCLFO|nr:hypothetical protein Z043_103480 [Scleropages formosus]
MANVVAFVDVWSSSRTENYSRPFIRQLQDMGAEVSKTFNKQVTHVVFNHGHQSTWNKAKKLGVKLVSVLWVDGCKASGQHVDEESYPAINEESTVNKVVKNRKHRCLQPRDVLEKTPDNNRRMKRKLDQMIKDLVPSSHIPISDTSPFIIDEESAIVYSPLSRRAESMAHRLKEMKEKRENLSPTASQMVESQLSFDEPDVGTPTHDSMQPEDEDSSYNLSFEELHTKRDKKEGKWKDSIKLSHAAGQMTGVMKGTEVPQRPRQRRKPSIPLDLRERSKPLSISTPDEDTVFEDYFSPANQQDGNRRRRPLSVTLSPESDPLPPFCLEPTQRKRKRVGSEDTPGDKKSHLETNTGSKHRVASGSPQGAAMDSRGTGNKMPTPEGASLNRNKGRSMEGHDLHGSISEGDSDTIDQTDERGFAVHDPVSLADGSDEQDKRGTELLSQDDEEESDQGLKKVESRDAQHKDERLAVPRSLFTDFRFAATTLKLRMVFRSLCVHAKRTLVMTSMSSEKRHTVLQLVDTLRGFSVVDTVCETTTHVVTGSPRRTLNVLLGIARGCWILSFEWVGEGRSRWGSEEAQGPGILWCLEHRRWIPEEPYELSDDFPAAPVLDDGCLLAQQLLELLLLLPKGLELRLPLALHVLHPPLQETGDAGKNYRRLANHFLCNLPSSWCPNEQLKCSFGSGFYQENDHFIGSSVITCSCGHWVV